MQCARLVVNKACDESGLAAELFQHVPDEFLLELRRLFFFSAAVSDSSTGLRGSLQALDETSWPFLSRWLRHCKGAGQIQARAPYGGAGRRLGSGGGAGASARSWLQRGSFLNIGNMGAVLVEEAGGNSMGQLGRPSVDEGSWRRRGACRAFACARTDKTGGFFAPSASCFYAQDDEATSSAAHEFWVCALLSASGFFLHIARPCAVVGHLGWGAKLWWCQLLAGHPPKWEGRLRSLQCGDRLVCGCGQGSSLSVRCWWWRVLQPPDTCGRLPVPEVYCGFGGSLIARTLRGGRHKCEECDGTGSDELWGGWGGASVWGRGFGTNVWDIGRRCCMGLWWNSCWRGAPVRRQARLGLLGRGGVGGLLQSWYGTRGLQCVAILDGGLGRCGKAGVGFVCCLLLKPPIQARQIRALASRWLLLMLLGRLGVPQWDVATGATGSLRAGRKVRTVVLGSHFLSLCAEPERLRCIAFI